jgi:hypothetical protein
MGRGPSVSRVFCVILTVGALFSENVVQNIIVDAQVVTVAGGQGSWELLSSNAGISSMHTAIDHYGQAIFLDRTDAGPSNINLTNCSVNCSAHSVLFSPDTGTVRPLTVITNTWCSSGQFTANGTLVQTGGDGLGADKVGHSLLVLSQSIHCDWLEEGNEELLSCID